MEALLRRLEKAEPEYYSPLYFSAQLIPETFQKSQSTACLLYECQAIYSLRVSSLPSKVVVKWVPEGITAGG